LAQAYHNIFVFPIPIRHWLGSYAKRAACALLAPPQDILRPCYGDLVDVANLYFSVPPMDKIDVGVPGVSFTVHPGSEAQTFGGRIYFSAPRSDVNMQTMSHEMIHVQQWDRNGRDLGTMGQKYMRDWCDAGFDYDK
jgi:hypothetical protein